MKDCCHIVQLESQPRVPYAHSLIWLQWADFAVQHKGTSYKLHVYVAWAKELTGDINNHGSQTDLPSAGISAGMPSH